MESWHRVLLLNRTMVFSLLLLGALSPYPVLAAEGDAAANARVAEPIIQPDLDRREIEEAGIDSEDVEVGAYIGLLSVEDFSTEVVVGVRLAYHLSEYLFVEGVYGQTQVDETSFERLTGISLADDEDRKYKYYNLSLGYNLLPGEAFVGKTWAFNNALYVIGGIGSTTFFGDQRFTGNVGVGYRLLFSDKVAAHLDLRDHIFNIDVLGEDKTTHNMELHGGITVFF